MAAAEEHSMQPSEHAPVPSASAIPATHHRAALQDRLEALRRRCALSEAAHHRVRQVLQASCTALDDTSSPADRHTVHLVLEAARIGLRSAKFTRCPPDYYAWTLEQRRAFLGDAPTVDHLCKSIVLWNTRAERPAAATDDASSAQPSPPLYICVVLPYAHRLHAEKVAAVVRATPQLTNGQHVPRKDVKYQLAPAEACEQLTGYTYNAVTPLGMRIAMPILVSDALLRAVQSSGVSTFWMGGGQVDLKLRACLWECIEVFGHRPGCSVHVADITYPERG
ncbi:hypothetical protein CDCA_CDCA19G4715 [Cyanidium caldarium]|uniref:YbaK/aminoacyl-tRNA synthetase-associated domain-containing protein n=1 Tax=Cyanidium caldarium TaxID=2771 RepID=A0AAV9J2U2_CYACA|nr:hypothetical protein CDCA_CDCA19G4715 [Cyanidium caldarium]